MGGTGDYPSSGVTAAAESAKWRSFPNNFVYSGHYSNGVAVNRGAYGLLWSRSAYNDSSAYSFSTGSTSLNLGTIGSTKYSGYSVRCIAQ